MNKLAINNKYLNGNIVYLGILTIKDMKLIYKWFNSKEITSKINKGYFPNTLNLQKKYFNKLTRSENDLQLSVNDKVSNLLIGTVGVHKIDWIHRTAELSIIINSNEKSKGAGTETIKLISNHCFKKLNLRKLKAGFWSNNIASKKVFEKNNFKFEFKRLKEFYYKGKYLDSLHYCKFK